MKDGHYVLEEKFGIETRDSVEGNRLAVLCDGICRCRRETRLMPQEWLREMKSLIESILATRQRYGLY